MLKRVISSFGIENDRLRLEWISASEGDKVRVVVNDMVAKIKALGPLGLPVKYKEWANEMHVLESEFAGKEEVYA